MAALIKSPEQYVAVGGSLPNVISYVLTSSNLFEIIEVYDSDNNLLFANRQTVIGGQVDFDIAYDLQSFVKNEPFWFFGTVTDEQATRKFYIVVDNVNTNSSQKFAVAAALDGYTQSLLPFVASTGNLLKFLQTLPPIAYSSSGCWLSVLTSASFVNFVIQTFDQNGNQLQAFNRIQETARGGIARIFMPYLFGAEYSIIQTLNYASATGNNIITGTPETLMSAVWPESADENVIKNGGDIALVQDSILGRLTARYAELPFNLPSNRREWQVTLEFGKTYIFTLKLYGISKSGLSSGSGKLTTHIPGDSDDILLSQRFDIVNNSNQSAYNFDREFLFTYQNTLDTGPQTIGIGVELDQVNVVAQDEVVTYLACFDLRGTVIMPDTGLGAERLYDSSPLGRSFAGVIDGFLYSFRGLTTISTSIIVFKKDLSQVDSPNISIYTFSAGINQNIVVDSQSRKFFYYRSQNYYSFDVDTLTETNLGVVSLGGGNPEGYFADHQNRWMYYVASDGNLYRHDLDNPSSRPPVLVSALTETGLSSSFAINEITQTVYQVSNTEKLYSIQATSLPATPSLLYTYLFTTGGMAYDPNKNRLYIADTAADVIRYGVPGSAPSGGSIGTPYGPSNTNGIGDVANITLFQVTQPAKDIEVSFSDFAIYETLPGNFQASEPIQIRYQEVKCNAVQVVWANPIGGWDTFIFDGFWDENFNTSLKGEVLDETFRLEKVISKESQSKLILRAGNIPAETMTKLKGLMSSPNVFIVEGQAFLRVVIETGSFPIQSTRGVNGYDLAIVARLERTNSL